MIFGVKVKIQMNHRSKEVRFKWQSKEEGKRNLENVNCAK